MSIQHLSKEITGLQEFPSLILFETFAVEFHERDPVTQILWHFRRREVWSANPGFYSEWMTKMLGHFDIKDAETDRLMIVVNPYTTGARQLPLLVRPRMARTGAQSVSWHNELNGNVDLVTGMPTAWGFKEPTTTPPFRGEWSNQLA